MDIQLQNQKHKLVQASSVSPATDEDRDFPIPSIGHPHHLVLHTHQIDASSHPPITSEISGSGEDEVILCVSSLDGLPLLVLLHSLLELRAKVSNESLYRPGCV